MSLFFYIGGKDIFKEKKFTEEKGKSNFITKKMAEALDIKNLSFLLGAGCSSLKIDGAEKGIPVMKDMILNFHDYIQTDENKEVFNIVFSAYKEKDGDKIKNLENFLGYLVKKESVFLSESNTDSKKIDKLIKVIIKFIFEKCSPKDESQVKEVYKNFYKKLLLRAETLPRINIFTTNYDLFSEKAMDESRIMYNNGFSGFMKRLFTPAVFTYSPYRDIEINSNTLLEVSNYFYLYKLHGSISWCGDDHNIEEVQNLKNPPSENHVMIYPTPLKHELSLGSPYSELFREFQKKMMMSNNVLVCVGYSFSDDHINNIIYQALSIPTFRLIVFGNPDSQPSIKELIELNDSRIWVIGGMEMENEDPIHYFKGFVENALPSLEEQKISKQIEEIEDYALKKKKLKQSLEKHDNTLDTEEVELVL